MMARGVDLSRAESIRMDIRQSLGSAPIQLTNLVGRSDGSVLVEIPASADILCTDQTAPYLWDCFAVGVSGVNPGTPMRQGYLFSEDPVTAGGAIAPTNIIPPQVTGTPGVGGTLSGTDGTWNASPEPTYTVEHVVDGIVVGTGATYDPVEADAGKAYIRRVTATNSADATPAESLPIFIVGGSVSPPANQLLDNTGAPIVDVAGDPITFLT